jgi:predicted dehydrogenase
MSDAIGFIVVGLGMGRNRAKMVKQTEGAKLVGVVDINEERAKKSRGGTQLRMAHQLPHLP